MRSQKQPKSRIGNKIKDALLLLDQAHVMEGEPVIDPVAFARRMEAFMKKAFKNKSCFKLVNIAQLF